MALLDEQARGNGGIDSAGKGNEGSGIPGDAHRLIIGGSAHGSPARGVAGA